jgi:hypothetical protein
MPRTSKSTLSADEIAEKASRGQDVSAYFTNKFRVVRPVQRVNIDLTDGMLRELDERASRLIFCRAPILSCPLPMAARSTSVALHLSRTPLAATAGAALPVILLAVLPLVSRPSRRHRKTEAVRLPPQPTRCIHQTRSRVQQRRSNLDSHQICLRLLTPMPDRPQQFWVHSHLCPLAPIAPAFARPSGRSSGYWR